MNVEFINEGNKLCADYLGYKYYKWTDKDIPNNLSGGWIHTKKQPKDRYYYLGRTAKEMAFHWDWNLLMLVVEKIESTRDEDFGWFQVYINANQCDIRSKYAYLSDNNVKSYISDPNAIFETKVQSTFYNVVNFLKFLKNNEKLREANQ
jgi:hypothetical protein